jgi:hypothetical protein
MTSSGDMVMVVVVLVRFAASAARQLSHQKSDFN